MTDQATFALRGRNPDVLTCIANLSNDEVFTPPEFANRMLDTLASAWADTNGGADIWADRSVTFLDPCAKSGVFLREIAKRLIAGLAKEIPDLQARVDHILTCQVFGIGITRLTSLLTRRSLYCSKHAQGEHSIAKGFDRDDGNVWFQRTEHSWDGNKCRFCGAGKSTFDRSDEMDSHAYAFIHADNIRAQIATQFGKEMQFDVIIGNPPYQLDDGGHGTSAAPIYHLFVEQAKKLEPRYLTMVIPSRWFAGGKGLDEFRASMLSDKRIRSIADHLSAADVFPGVGLKGGVCYFLWDKDNSGPCTIATHFGDWPVSETTRPLQEDGTDIFLRFNEGVSILRKVISIETGQDNFLSLPDEKRFDRIVSARKPFGLETKFSGSSRKRFEDDLTVYQNGGVGYSTRDSIISGQELIDKWKLFVGYAAPGTGNKDSYPHRIISTPFVSGPGTISSETYLCIGPFDAKGEAESALSYLSCRLTRLLILLRKSSQHVTKKVYGFVPIQDWSRKWSDEELYARYQLLDEEIAFIEKIIRPMEGGA